MSDFLKFFFFFSLFWTLPCYFCLTPQTSPILQLVPRCQGEQISSQPLLLPVMRLFVIGSRLSLAFFCCTTTLLAQSVSTVTLSSSSAVLLLFLRSSFCFCFPFFGFFECFCFFLIKSKYGSLYMAAWNSILLFLTISLIYWDRPEFCPALWSASCCCQLMSLQTHFSAEKCWALDDSLGCSSSPAVSCAPDWQDLDPEGRCFSSLLLKIPLGALSKSLSCLSSGAFAAFLLPVEQKEMLLVSRG